MSNNDGGDETDASRSGKKGNQMPMNVDGERSSAKVDGAPSAVSSSSSSSYVYPIRSLLSGVQPSEQAARASTTENLGAANAQIMRDRRLSSGVISAHSSSSGRSSQSKGSASSIIFKSSTSNSSKSGLQPQRVVRLIPDDPNSSSVEFPDATQEPQSATLQDPVLTTPVPTTVRLSGDRDLDEYNPRRPEPIQSAGAEFLAAAYTNPIITRTPVDFSRTGIVHLAPVSRSTGGSESASGGSSGTSQSSQSHTRSLQTSERTHSSQQFSPSQNSGSESESGGERSNNSSQQLSTTSSELVSQKFSYAEDENGFFIVTGRDGRISRCEDEPIHAPGTVQGFGVLIAIEEDSVSGSLVVRQVSENSTELLGLSPSYLFSLACFTQTLPDSQADLLWDNVQFLHDSEYETESEVNDNPQVFLLSGWGEPGSFLSDEEEYLPENVDDRRHWTCWCAAHRPPYRPGIDQDNGNRPKNIIVFEFELERDAYNPLYPSFESEIVPGVSPESNKSSHSSERNSGSSTTTFSRSSGSTTEMVTPSHGFGSFTPDSNVGGSPDAPAPLQTNDTTSRQTSAQAMANINPAELFLSSKQGLEGDESWFPRPEDIFESTTSHSKPLKALERMRRVNRTFGGGGESHTARSTSSSRSGQTGRQRARARRGATQGIGTLDIFAVLAQVNEQLSSAPDLETFLKVVVGVVKDLTQYHRVLVYQFDENWNGQVVSELVDWRQSHELYRGLHFPASDIPAQARELYRINKVRLLYNRSQVTARLVVRSREDLDYPLDMTHSFLRAMSPIHIKYLANMGVRSSMSISIVTFGALWGLISCHSYGINGMRVSFPVRQMLRLLADSISRNIERLSYAQRLQTRKLVSTLPTDSHPTGYIVSNAEDLLGLFDADFGVLVIGDGAKILGPNSHGQEILVVAEYLRLKQFTLMQVSQSLVKDFPDLQLPSGLEVIAGLLCVPLSRGGKDFIAFLRKGQLRDVHWAGRPYKDASDTDNVLEPRKSFKTWSETVTGRCRSWTDEQMETAGVLALVYGKFIEVWRQKETAIQSTQLTNLLLSNASHEVRTPLNHIINYLEMALNGPLDNETRNNLSESHSASKSLLFSINDLLDLTRLESGGLMSFNEPFNLHEVISDATSLYRNEAIRRNLKFDLNLSECPTIVIGDAKKIRTVVANLTANAVKYTESGQITIACRTFKEPRGLRNVKEVAVEIVVKDTGCGMENSKLESIFREFEQVESSVTHADFPGLGTSQVNLVERFPTVPMLGLGLAVVARTIEQLGGQLRVDSKPGDGSRFSFLIPFELPTSGSEGSESHEYSIRPRSRTSSSGSSEIDNLVDAFASDSMGEPSNKVKRKTRGSVALGGPPVGPGEGRYDVTDSRFPIRSVKIDDFDVDRSVEEAQIVSMSSTPRPLFSPGEASTSTPLIPLAEEKLRILIVEDDRINRTILSKRLTLDGHTVVDTMDGQQGAEAMETDYGFDCVLMDIQMPILNGFESTKRIRAFEKANPDKFNAPPVRTSKRLNGRIPIFAVSASLQERQREEMIEHGMDGWILKPIDFNRLRVILKGITDAEQRQRDVYHPGCSWEEGGWLQVRQQVAES